MPSIQSKILKSLMRLQTTFTAKSGRIDIAKERAKLISLASIFKAVVSFESQPVTVAGVPAEWITITGATPDKVLLYLHGGSYTAGSIFTHRTLAANTAWVTGARTLLIDYRLAPEHVYPAALEDAGLAYAWLIEQGFRPDQLFVAGDSAGGGLAIALLLKLRDLGKPMPSRLICYSPWTDLALTGETYQSNAKKDVVVSVDELRQSSAFYLGGVDPCTPYASPLYGDAQGLPATLVQVGSDEMLLSDAVRWADAARLAGVAVSLEVWDGMQHEWQYVARLIPEGRQALEHVREFVQGQGTSTDFE